MERPHHQADVDVDVVETALLAKKAKQDHQDNTVNVKDKVRTVTDNSTEATLALVVVEK